MENIYPKWKEKIYRNALKAKETPKQFADKLNLEYNYLINSKQKKLRRLSKIPIRIYGSGDYISEHFDFLTNLRFPHFIISKNLTTKKYINEIEKLDKYDKNLTSIVLSYYINNIDNYIIKNNLKIQNTRIKLSFTGNSEEYYKVINKGFKFDIFFNTLRTKQGIEQSRKIKEQCPCDSKLIEHNESCTYCNKCWKPNLN